MSDLGIYLDIRADGAQKTDADVKKVAKSANKLEQDAKKASDGVKKLDTSLKESGSSASSASLAFGSLSSMLGGIATFAGAKSIINTADAMTSLRSQVRFVTKDIAELNAVQAQLMQISNRTYSTIEATTSLYTRTARALQDAGRSQKEFLVFTEAVNNAMRVGGRGAQEQASALLQLSQALGSGVLQGDEFRSIAENAPIILDIVAEYMGKTRGEIRKLSSEGVITSELLFNAISSSSEALKQQASTMELTFGQALISLKNNSAAGIESINNMLGVTNALASGVSFLAKNISVLLIPASGLLVVGLVKGFTLAKTAVLAFNAALFANPVTAIIAGVAMAGAAIMAFAGSASQASKELDNMRSKIDATHDSLNSMTEAMLREHKQDLEVVIKSDGDDLIKMGKEIDRLRRKIDSLKETSIGTGGLYGERIRQNIEKHSSTLIKLEAQYDRLSLKITDYWGKHKDATIALSGGLSVDETPKASQEYLDMEKSITEQVLKRNLSGQEGVIIYERMFGKLQNITDKEFEALQLRARSADIQERMLSQQDAIAGKLDSINDRYAKIGMTALQADLYDLKKAGVEGQAYDDAEAKLIAIHNAPKIKTGGTKTDPFGDRLVSLSQELSALQALNSEMAKYGSPSLYNSVSELTLEFNNQSSALYKLSGAQKEALLTQAQQIDSQRQLNEILKLKDDTSKSLDDMQFEIELIGMTSREIEKMRFGRDLEMKAKEISIGMTQENIDILYKELEAYKELYDQIQKNKDLVEDDPLQGIRDGLEKFIEEAGTAREAFENATKGALNSMADGLADFVATGKLDFADLTRSILQDISKIIAKWAIAQALGGLGKSFSFGFASGGFVPEFSSGGYTGAGGKYEPKGVVHGGEYVFSKESVSRIGLGNLDRLHKGFATGGFVGNAGNLEQGSGVVINQTFQIESGANIDEQMIDKLRQEMHKETVRVSKNIALGTIGEQKRSGGMLRG